MEQPTTLPSEATVSNLFIVRDQLVMPDAELALLYGVELKQVLERVKRFRSRFPEDFMFQLSGEEYELLLQNAPQQTRRRNPPFVFTECGAVMLATILTGEQAEQATIFVIREFVAIRNLLLIQQELSQKLEDLETSYNAQFTDVFDALRQISNPDPNSRPPIGFNRPKKV